MRHVFLDIETTGLSPLVHRVVCVGLKYKGDEEAIFLQDRNEKKMLTDLTEVIREWDVLIGYNLGFDVGFTVMRCLRHGVSPGWVHRVPRIDLMEKIRELTGSRVTLRRAASFFGLGGSKGDGADVPDMWEGGFLEEIREHCLSDVELTERLFEKLKPVAVELATVPQREYMRDLKVPFDESTTKAEASELLGRARRPPR